MTARNNLRKRLFAISLVCTCTLVSLSGCTGKSSATGTVSGNEEITLLEPENVAANYEVASYHNLYKSIVYPASVCTYVKEFETTNELVFSNYNVSPGEQIAAGTPLVYGKTDDYNKKIEELNDQISDMDIEHELFVQNANDELDGPRKDKEFYYRLTKEYADREAEFNEYGNKYQDISIEVKQKETALAKANALYEVERAHMLKQIEHLQAKIDKCTLFSDISGTVMAMTSHMYGDKIAPHTGMVAIGDTSRKQIRSNFIAKSDIAGAEEIYAFFHGKKYPVTYEPMSSEEYSRHVESNEDAYSTFILNEDTDELALGDYGAVAVILKARDHVLSVTKKAVHKDDEGYFVYTLDGEESVRTSVTLGMDDGTYTEILSGLKEGDKVLTTEVLTALPQRATVTYGTLTTPIETTANFYCPHYTIIKNPVEYADSYFSERVASQYQPVKTGDVLAKVRVVRDDYELQRQNLQLTRQQSRLTDLQQELEKEKNLNKKKDIQRSITQKQYDIAKINKKIAKLQKDFEVSDITSPVDGVIIWTSEHKEEQKLKYEDPLFYISPSNQCFMQISDPNHLFTYGNQIDFSYLDSDNKLQPAVATIVSAGRSSLSADLASDFSILQIPPEAVTDISYSTENANNLWSQSIITIGADTQVIDNILIVPKVAVTTLQRQTYVKVVEKDGSVHYQSFLACGFDRNYYGVIDGLTEGMEVCYE